MPFSVYKSKFILANIMLTKEGHKYYLFFQNCYYYTGSFHYFLKPYRYSIYCCLCNNWSGRAFQQNCGNGATWSKIRNRFIFEINFHLFQHQKKVVGGWALSKLIFWVMFLSCSSFCKVSWKDALLPVKSLIVTGCNWLHSSFRFQQVITDYL